MTTNEAPKETEPPENPFYSDEYADGSMPPDPSRIRTRRIHIIR